MTFYSFTIWSFIRIFLIYPFYSFINPMYYSSLTSLYPALSLLKQLDGYNIWSFHCKLKSGRQNWDWKSKTAIASIPIWNWSLVWCVVGRDFRSKGDFNWSVHEIELKLFQEAMWLLFLIINLTSWEAAYDFEASYFYRLYKAFLFTKVFFFFFFFSYQIKIAAWIEARKTEDGCHQSLIGNKDIQ